MRIIILASGHSLLDYKPEEIKQTGAAIIAVNGAYEYLDRPDYFFTLDPSEENLKRIDECVRRNIKCVVALPKGSPTIKGTLKLERISNEFDKSTVNDDSPEYWLKRWGCVEGLQEDPLKISTGNSTYGALNLAYHLINISGDKENKILILGLDGTEHGHYNDGKRTNSLKHLNLLFDSALPQLNNIDVRNGSTKSNINSFIKIIGGLKWISQQ